MTLTEKIQQIDLGTSAETVLPLGTNPYLTEQDKAILVNLGLHTESLQTFEHPSVLYPEALGTALTETDTHTTLWADSQTAHAGEAYMNMLNIPSFKWTIQEVGNPVDRVQQPDDTIGLVVRSATDPALKDQMFNNTKLQLFADGIYLPVSGFAGPHLWTIGVNNTGTRLLGDRLAAIQQRLTPDKLAAARSKQQERFLTPDHLTNWQVRQLLRSDKVSKIPAHALGPDGTNISQAMRLWLEQVEIANKAVLTIHPAGVEPLGDNGSSSYVEIAAGQVADGVVPTHMECAVYYNQPKLWLEKGPNQTVFMDHQNMPLDNMLVAGPANLAQLSGKSKLVVATHISPKPLIEGWLGDNITWIKATSNSAAANMVAANEVDLCVTTGQGVANNRAKLQVIYNCGCPVMTFTIATPLPMKQLVNM